MPKKDVERRVIEQYIQSALESIKSDRRVINNIKTELLKNGVKAGEVQYIIDGRTHLSEINVKVLCLLMIKLAKYTRMEVSPDAFFTPQEIKESKLTEIDVDGEIGKVEFPYTFHNVNMVEQDSFSTVITAQELKKLFDSNLLEYNPETQRETRILRNKKNPDEIIHKPKTIINSVREIEELFISGRLISSTLTFNVRLGSSDSGEDVVFDPKSRTLTVSKGAKIDVLDGYHRLSGVLSALRKNPELDKTFRLDILNYSTKTAQNHFVQINTTNPIALGHKKAMSQKRHADYIARELQNNCEFLTDKITTADHISTKSTQLVTFNLISDAIDEVYNAENKIEAMQVIKYLVEFFNELFLKYPEPFVTNIVEYKDKSMMNANITFYGYILLSKILKDKKLPLSAIPMFIESIDFDRGNPLWREKGVINEDKNITPNAKKKARETFNQLFLNEVISGV